MVSLADFLMGVGSDTGDCCLFGVAFRHSTLGSGTLFCRGTLGSGARTVSRTLGNDAGEDDMVDVGLGLGWDVALFNI